MNFCHTQKFIISDQFYRKRHAEVRHVDINQHQAGSKILHIALLECAQYFFKFPFLQKNSGPTLQNLGLDVTLCYVAERKTENPPVNCYKSIHSHQKFLTSAGCPLGKILIYRNLQTERTKNLFSILGFFFSICLEKNKYLSSKRTLT